ncbi:MAG: beta-CASP ribonuclease aCPSF1 [Thermoprotei archaeon]
MTQPTTIKNHLSQIRTLIFSSFPPEGELNRIEFEGPEIALYCKNPAAVLSGDDVVRKMAKILKKRVVIRTDPSVRKSEAETIRILEKMIPANAEVKEYTFNPDTGDVLVEALRPGIVIGTGGSVLRSVIVETGWRPVVVRVPEIRSGIVASMLRVLNTAREYRQKFLKEVGERIHRPAVITEGAIRVVPLGAFGEVGRSAILVDTEESKVLLDCGLKAEATDLEEEFPAFHALDFPIEELDAVIIAHAHMDHQGSLPYLFKYGFRGPVYMTAPTRDLMLLSQKDYIDLKQRIGETPPYGIEHVKKAILHTIPVDWGEVTDITPDIKLTLTNAGHILGSSIVHLNIGEGRYNIVYTSDLKYAPTSLLDKANSMFPRVDCLIIESTYGGRDNLMPNRKDAEDKFASIVNKTLSQGGKVLIPTLAVGRAQEVMMIIAEKITAQVIPPVPVYLDGMLLESTAIHTAYPEFLAVNVRRKIYQGDNPFLHKSFVRIDDVSKRDEAIGQGPCIIMATSGMMTGGPVLEYFKYLCEDERNSLVFVNYQAESTLGRAILKGLKEVTLPNGSSNAGKTYSVKMGVYSIEGFSGHSDRAELVRYAAAIRPLKHVFINHGEPSRSAELAKEMRKVFMYGRQRPQISTPANLDAIRLR